MEISNSGKRKTEIKNQKDSSRSTAKTLLTALPTFSKFIKATSKDILIKAQNSYINYSNTYNQAVNLCNLICDNLDLGVIQNRIKALLVSASDLHQKVIYLFYHHQLSTAKMASILGVSRRTVFRYLSTATDWVAEHIEEVINPHSFTRLLQTQTWINNIHKRLLAE